MVSAVGVGTEETWRNLLAGKSGVAPITHFDTTGFSATIAAEVKGFDPLQYVEKKDLKKMGLLFSSPWRHPNSPWNRPNSNSLRSSRTARVCTLGQASEGST